MPKFDCRTLIRIGKYRTGKSMEIPSILDLEIVPRFIDSLDVDSVLDLSCALEYLILECSKNRIRSFDLRSLESFYTKVFERLKIYFFQSKLEELGLVTSVDRVKLGRKLAE